MVTIHIKEYDLYRFEIWAKNHDSKIGIVEGKFPYNDFVIAIDTPEGICKYEVGLKDNDPNKSKVIYKFHLTEDTREITDLKSDYKILKTLIGFEKSKKSDSQEDKFKMNMLYAWCFYIQFMTYIMHKLNRRKSIVVETEKEYKPKNNVSAGSGSKSKKVFMVEDFVIYKHRLHTGISKKFTCEAWGVRGHERHYKSGKVIWIKPYVKGDKTKVVDKDVYLNKQLKH